MARLNLRGDSGYNSARKTNEVARDAITPAVELIRDTAMPSNPQRKLPFEPAAPGEALEFMRPALGEFQFEIRNQEKMRRKPAQWDAGAALNICNQCRVVLPQHCLNFLPDPHGHGSFRPIFGIVRRKVGVLPSGSL